MGNSERYIAYGMTGTWFYYLSELNDGDGENYYCLYHIEDFPPSMHPEDIQKFIDGNRNEGDSYAGDWNEVMKYLNDMFQYQMGKI